jgi:phosphate/sulfate permease
MVDVNLILSAALLIGAFMVAIKVLKTMFEAAVVAGISAVFYAIMATSFGYPLGFDNVLFFAALGTGLYVGYSVLLPLLGLGWGLLKLPFDFASYAAEKFGGIKRHRRLSKIEKTLNKHEDKLEDEEEKEDTTKEVVLDKVAGKDSSSD